MSITIKNNINIAKKIAKVSNKKLWMFAGREWYRLMFPFIPFRTGALAALVDVEFEKPISEQEALNRGLSGDSIKADNQRAEIHFKAPYSRKQYYGNFNWRDDLHNLATGQWDKAAEPTQRKKLIEAMQAYIKRGAK